MIQTQSSIPENAWEEYRTVKDDKTVIFYVLSANVETKEANWKAVEKPAEMSLAEMRHWVWHLSQVMQSQKFVLISRAAFDELNATK